MTAEPPREEVAPREEVSDLAARLEAHFRDVNMRAMADVPICNPALDVACVGFREWNGQALGIVLTPWFMNIALAPLCRFAAHHCGARRDAKRGLSLRQDRFPGRGSCGFRTTIDVFAVLANAGFRRPGRGPSDGAGGARRIFWMQARWPMRRRGTFTPLRAASGKRPPSGPRNSACSRRLKRRNWIAARCCGADFPAPGRRHELDRQPA